MSMNAFQRSLGLLGVLLLPFAQADADGRGADWSENVQVHGFVTQGFVKTNHNRFFGSSEDGSFEFTELGINGSLRPTSDLLFTGQLLARKAGDMYDGSPVVDFALVRWNPIDDGVNQVGVSAGRLKNPVGLYNQTRDVAQTRPGIFVPQVVYYDKVRNLELSGDGVALHLRRFSEMGELALDYHLVKQLVDENVEAAFLGMDWGGQYESNKLANIGQVRFSTPDERWRFALSYVDTTLDFRRSALDPIGDGHMRVQFLVGSVQFNNSDWTVSAEYAYEPIKWAGFDLPGPGMPRVDRKWIAESYYLQIERHLNNDVSVFARYETAYANRDDKDGELAAALTGPTVKPYNFYSKIFTVGARWDVTPRFMLRAEYAVNDGTFVLSSIENPIGAELSKHWSMFSLLGSYRF